MKRLLLLLNLARGHTDIEFVFVNIDIQTETFYKRTTDRMDNVKMMGMIPQLQLLSRASFFITHCGFNSVKEAILLDVPVIGIIKSKVHDQDLTAKTIERIGVGTSISLKKLTEKDMNSMIYEFKDRGFRYSFNKEIKSKIINDLDGLCDDI